MKLLVIDGTEVEVMDYQWMLADQDLDSGRNLAGYMERNLLDHSVNKLTIVFPPQNGEDRSAILKLLHKEELVCKFLSPYSNAEEQHIMMHGDLKSALYWNIENVDGMPEVLYNSFQVELVEY